MPKPHIKDGKIGYTLTATEIRQLNAAADILQLVAQCGHKNAGDTAARVRAIATGEAYKEPETGK